MQSFLACFSCGSSTVPPVLTWVTQSNPNDDSEVMVQNPRHCSLAESEPGDNSVALSQLSTKISTPKNHRGDQLQDEITQLKGLTASSRKKREAQFIKKYIRHSKNLYLVEMEWSELYTDYLRAEGASELRAIDNSKLFDNGEVRTDILPKKDFYEVTEEIWRMVVTLYSGGPAIKKPKSPVGVLPVKGIQNKLYSCFMNSGLQCLLSVSQFVEYFDKATYTNITYESLNPKQKLCRQTTIMIQAMTQTQLPYIRNISFRELIEKKFDRSTQHDSHEFIRYYLSTLQDEINPKQAERKQERAKTTGNGQGGLASYCEYLQKHPSIVDQLFSGMLRNTVKCGDCGNRSVTYDPFLELTVEITHDNLGACLDQYFSEEKLDSPIHCQKCALTTKSTRKLAISQPPAYLTIVLKRFASSTSKNNSVVKYTASMDLSRFFSRDAQGLLELIAVIVHSGSLDKGHYYCFARRSDQWYEFNDNKSKLLSPSEVLDGSAYILLYRSQR